MILAILMTVAMAAPKGWEIVGNRDNIEVARKTIAGSDLFAFRGETIVDQDPAILASVLLNDDIGPEWVDLMHISRKVKDLGEDRKLVHQGYDLKWPVQDRDYSLDQQAQYDRSSKTFNLLFKSVVDSDLPENACCIRAIAERTYWSISVTEDGLSKVTVEVITDPKGALPAWLINMIQKDWPYNTISALLRRARKGDVKPNPKMIGWAD